MFIIEHYFLYASVYTINGRKFLVFTYKSFALQCICSGWWVTLECCCATQGVHKCSGSYVTLQGVLLCHTGSTQMFWLVRNISVLLCHTGSTQMCCLCTPQHTLHWCVAVPRREYTHVMCVCSQHTLHWCVAVPHWEFTNVMARA